MSEVAAQRAGELLGEAFAPDRDLARALDARDPLRGERELFHVPKGPDGGACVYLTGNSLGLMPRSAEGEVVRELEDWRDLAVDAHFDGRAPWYSYAEALREPSARLVGARPGEVVMMNSLTANLHLLMASFYRPTRGRWKILIEGSAFPSDEYAVQSQARYHGFDPAETIVRVTAREGERAIRPEDFIGAIEREGERLAVVIPAGVSYVTGELFDMPAIVDAAKKAGATVGFDLAHAAGNAKLALHEWGADFAVWCSYKYLNAGPGAPAGAFVHERHWGTGLPRFEGWWGNDAQTRFEMRPEFREGLGAEAWALSNPPILSMAPLRASLAIFDRVGMGALREKSLRLHAYTRALLEARCGGRVSVATPAEDGRHGCQLSIVVGEGAKALRDALQARGVVADYRRPDVVRVAPVPLYNSFDDCWRFVEALAGELGA